MLTLARLISALALAVVPIAHADYESDVLPIFQQKCFSCHGDGKTKGAVNLDPEHMSRLFGATKFITAGDAEASRLYQVTTLDRGDQDFMPPIDKGDPLTATERRKVKAWIDSGAAVAAMGPSEEAPAVAMGAPENETWINREGREITAKLVRVSGDTAVLVMANGKSYDYPIANLSDESQAKIRAFSKGG
ncbi:hypothetical protein BH23VER1_BH23VER1_00470 [soil metagenome]